MVQVERKKNKKIQCNYKIIIYEYDVSAKTGNLLKMEVSTVLLQVCTIGFFFMWIEIRMAIFNLYIFKLKRLSI